MPTRDPQPVKVCGRAFRIGLVRQPLDDETRSLPVGRNGVEHVDGVRKGSRGG